MVDFNQIDRLSNHQKMRIETKKKEDEEEERKRKRKTVTSLVFSFSFPGFSFSFSSTYLLPLQLSLSLLTSVGVRMGFWCEICLREINKTRASHSRDHQTVLELKDFDGKTLFVERTNGDFSCPFCPKDVIKVFSNPISLIAHVRRSHPSKEKSQVDNESPEMSPLAESPAASTSATRGAARFQILDEENNEEEESVESSDHGFVLFFFLFFISSSFLLHFFFISCSFLHRFFFICSSFVLHFHFICSLSSFFFFSLLFFSSF